MNKFINKVRDLSQRAAEIKAAAERVPAQVRDLRETVAATTGQFQQLRADVQSSVAGLRADNETHLIEALAELNDSLEIFSEAGYAMEGVDLELNPVQRLIVHLRKFEDVSEAGLNLLLAAIAKRKTAHAVLAALIKAEQLADRVSLTNLTYRELTIYVGPVPTVRLCWRPETEVEAEPQNIAAKPMAPVVPPPLPEAASSSPGSFFERRSTPAPKIHITPEPAIPEPAPVPVSISVPAASETPPEPVNWGASALDRFKKMPDLTKRSH